MPHRSIPTGVGTTSWACLRMPCRAVHPHGRGDYDYRAQNRGQAPVHPHGRGDYGLAPSSPCAPPGPSPRAWGLPLYCPVSSVHERSIPTGVGTTPEAAEFLGGGLDPHRPSRPDAPEDDPHILGAHPGVLPGGQEAVYLLFRRTHEGTVWFDDVSLSELGSTKNLLRNPGFEGKARKGKIDGVYLDSYEMGAVELNFRRDHFRSSDIPLTFHRQTHWPCQLFVFHTYEFEREIANRMHDQNDLLFANGVLWKFPFPAHLLDVLGTEVNWLPGGKYRPDSDTIMNYRRALCYRKPYCLLMNANYEDFNYQLVEKYFKRCLFYAIFPSFFDEEAASKDPYWTSPRKWYERDRQLFKKYLPLIISLAEAGWEPLTYATSNNKKVYIERYGRAKDENLHFTVFNDGDGRERFRLAFDLSSLGIRGNVEIKEMLSGKSIPVSVQRGMAETEGELEPEDIWLLKVNPTR